jgi:general secretion pathway protein J
MRQPAGFTLVEMTVALALLGFVALLVFESLRFGQRSYEQATRRGAEAWQVFAAHRLIRNLIESAYPQQPDGSVPSLEPGLQGDALHMFITAPAPLATGGAGLYRYEVALRANAAGGTDLVIRWHPQMSDAISSAASEAEEVLLERVAGLRLSYQQGTDWTERWSQPELPTLVRMQVRFASDDARKWPDMTAGPRITNDANCIFDTVAQRCRKSAS